MSEYKICLVLNPKPVPFRTCDWDCWLEDDPEFGTDFGATPSQALQYMAERIEEMEGIE